MNKIEIIQGDITKVRVDAIVNAAETKANATESKANAVESKANAVESKAMSRLKELFSFVLTKTITGY